MITKEITPQQIAGDLANKLLIKNIIIDSEQKEIFVTDAIKTVGGEDITYYKDIAYTIDDLPCELTEEEIESLR